MPVVSPRLAAGILAVTLPLLLPLAAVPDTVFYNQLAAVAGWGAWLMTARTPTVLAASPDHYSATALPVYAASAALAICALLAATRFGVGQATVVLMLVAAIAALWAGARSGPADFGAIAFAWWLAGLLSVGVAAVQYFEPSLANGWPVATNASPGRAVGNMRQPNHLATAVVCAMVMTAWLWQTKRLSARIAGVSIVAMVFALVLSASRTGALALMLLTAWAALDRSPPRSMRLTLASTPLLYLVIWAVMAAHASLGQASFFGAERWQSGGDISSARFAIWANALAVIEGSPWAGVGWGNFNFAWTFTALPDRPVEFFDHTHDLPLQLAAEIGLPATLAVLGLVAWALWRNVRAWSATGGNEAQTELAAATLPITPALLALLSVLALHSLLEYPLWYAYFLLPAAWALGALLGAAGGTRPVHGGRPASPWLLRAAGMAMLAGALYAAWDHRRIEVIFTPPPGAGSLEARITRGQRSVLFGHHADYAAVTTERGAHDLATFRRPLHQLIDVRLLIAYIEALKAAGQDDRALYAAQRLREFRRPEAQAYFEGCDAGQAEEPWQCERAPVRLTWRDMEP